MADIKFYDYVKDVELNRRKLVDATGSSKLDSLDNVTNTAVEKLSQVEKEKHEVRFFDADGTLLKTEYIEDGGTATPPDDPVYDSERLVFDRWCSAIGNVFTNITHDVDYGAHYYIKDDKYHIFCEFNATTGYDVKIPISVNGSTSNPITVYVDWGDGQQEEFLYTTYSSNLHIDHTYTQGTYEIRLHSSKDDYKNLQTIAAPSFMVATWRKNLLDYSSTTSNNINAAVKKYYCPIAYGGFGIPSVNLYDNRIFVIGYCVLSANSDASMLSCTTIIPNTNLTTSVSVSSINITLNYSKMFIIDKAVKLSGGVSISYIHNLDKIIIPSNLYCSSISSIYKQCKVILIDANTRPDVTWSYCYGLYALEVYGTTNKMPRGINEATALKYFKFPTIMPNIPATLLSRASLLNPISISSGWNIDKDTFNSWSVTDLDFPINFNYSVSFNYAYPSINTFIDMANKFVDNSTSGISNILKLSNVQITTIKNIYIKLNNGFYEQSTLTEANTTTVFDVLINKNWTIST